MPTRQNVTLLVKRNLSFLINADKMMNSPRSVEEERQLQSEEELVASENQAIGNLYFSKFTEERKKRPFSK